MRCAYVAVNPRCALLLGRANLPPAARAQSVRLFPTRHVFSARPHPRPHHVHFRVLRDGARHGRVMDCPSRPDGTSCITGVAAPGPPHHTTAQDSNQGSVARRSPRSTQRRGHLWGGCRTDRGMRGRPLTTLHLLSASLLLDDPSPEASSIPIQYSLPGYELPSHAYMATSSSESALSSRRLGSAKLSGSAGLRREKMIRGPLPRMAEALVSMPAERTVQKLSDGACGGVPFG